MFALAIRSDRMKNPKYEIEASQPLMGKYVVMLLEEGKVVRKFSSYDKGEMYRQIQGLAEAESPKGHMFGAGMPEDDKVYTV